MGNVKLCLNPNMKVVKKDITNWLYVGIIHLILDSDLVSAV